MMSNIPQFMSPCKQDHTQWAHRDMVFATIEGARQSATKKFTDIFPSLNMVYMSSYLATASSRDVVDAAVQVHIYISPIETFPGATSGRPMPA